MESVTDVRLEEIHVGQGDGKISTTVQGSKVVLRQYFCCGKLGNLAEGVILPKNRRSQQTKPSAEDVPLDDVSQPRPTAQRQVFEFPIFMVLISFLQITVYYATGEWGWLAFCYDPWRRHEIWRFFTMMLVHNSHLHLWGNVFFQLILGVLLEIVHHWKRTGVIYLASVLGGTLFITVIDPKVYSVGASGGVYGLLLAHLALILLNWNEMDRKIFRILGLLAYALFDFGIGTISGVKASHAGHIGGAVFGFLTSTLVLKKFEDHPWKKIVQKICATILVAIVMIIVLTNVFSPSLYCPSEFNMDYERSLLSVGYKLIDKSPPDSDLRKTCDEQPVCKEGLQLFRNQTMHCD